VVSNEKSVSPWTSEAQPKPSGRPAASPEVFRDRLKDGIEGPEMAMIPLGLFGV
jgi:hypothetical protein